MNNALVWRSRITVSQMQLKENLRDLEDVSEETSLIHLQGDVSEICKSSLFEISLRRCMRRLKDASKMHLCPLGFGLLRDLLHRQNMTNKWFERSYNGWQCFSLVFGKRISPWFHQVVFAFIVRIVEVTLKWLWPFQLSIMSISCMWTESSVRCFLSAAFIENSKSYIDQ